MSTNKCVCAWEKSFFAFFVILEITNVITYITAIHISVLLSVVNASHK